MLFSLRTLLLYILIRNTHKGFQFFYTLVNPVLRKKKVTSPKGCQAIIHCGFDEHFPNYSLMLSIFLSPYWPCLYYWKSDPYIFHSAHLLSIVKCRLFLVPRTATCLPPCHPLVIVTSQQYPHHPACLVYFPLQSPQPFRKI